MATDVEILKAKSPGPGQLRRWLERRKFGEPIEHILGEVQFMKRWYSLGPGVYTTDITSEKLIEKVVQDYEGQTPTIIDVGTGCGNIAITLALELPGSRVIGCDLNPYTLGYARENAARHGAKVEFYESLYLDDIPMEILPDVIVANLPWGDKTMVLQENDLRELRYMPLAYFHPDGIMASYKEMVDSIERRGWNIPAYIETGLIGRETIREEITGVKIDKFGPVTRLEVAV